MATAQPLPSITERTYAVIRDLMARDGLDSNDAEQIALYMERLVARERLFRTVDEIRKQTSAIPEEELQRMIDEAVEEVEANHRGRASGASSA